MVHQFDPQMAPDSAFEPGSLHHLCPGNNGRMLDPRRTPILIRGVRPDVGVFELEVAGFEDRGARWELPLEDIAHFQFPFEARRAGATEVAAFESAIRRFDVRLDIACESTARQRTLARLADQAREAARWIERHSRFAAEGGTRLPLEVRDGDPRLWKDTRAYMATHGLDQLEDQFATGYVSNPRSRELAKGHEIVLAEMGLSPFRGTIVRDPTTFEGLFSKAWRARHLLARMAFVSAVFERTGNSEVTLYRGVAFHGDLERRPPHGFVSATFSLEVARALFDPAGGTPRGVLYRQRTPARRLFMTYVETAQMNHPFREAEAVLLGDGANPLF